MSKIKIARKEQQDSHKYGKSVATSSKPMVMKVTPLVPCATGVKNNYKGTTLSPF